MLKSLKLYIKSSSLKAGANAGPDFLIRHQGLDSQSICRQLLKVQGSKGEFKEP